MPLARLFFSFPDVCRRVAGEVSKVTYPSAVSYLEVLVSRIKDVRREVKPSGRVDNYPTVIGHEGLIANVVFIGYCNSPPLRAYIEFNHEGGGQQLTSDSIRTVETNRARLMQAFEIFSGPVRIKDLMFDLSFSRFDRYRTNELRQRRLPVTLEGVQMLAENYIEACKGNPQIDQECRLVGGHIHSAAITPFHGFCWLKPPVAPQDQS